LSDFGFDGVLFAQSVETEEQSLSPPVKSHSSAGIYKPEITSDPIISIVNSNVAMLQTMSGSGLVLF